MEQHMVFIHDKWFFTAGIGRHDALWDPIFCIEKRTIKREALKSKIPAWPFG